MRRERISVVGGVESSQGQSLQEYIEECACLLEEDRSLSLSGVTPSLLQAVSSVKEFHLPSKHLIFGENAQATNFEDCISLDPISIKNREKLIEKTHFIASDVDNILSKSYPSSGSLFPQDSKAKADIETIKIIKKNYVTNVLWKYFYEEEKANRLDQPVTSEADREKLQNRASQYFAVVNKEACEYLDETKKTDSSAQSPVSESVHEISHRSAALVVGGGVLLAALGVGLSFIPGAQIVGFPLITAGVKMSIAGAAMLTLALPGIFVAFAGLVKGTLQAITQRYQTPAVARTRDPLRSSTLSRYRSLIHNRKKRNVQRSRTPLIAITPLRC